jgi:hypothetical protein
MDSIPDRHDGLSPAAAISPDTLDRFRALVLADPTLQETLRCPDDPDRFVALVVQTAQTLGLALAPQAVHAAMRGPLPDMAAPDGRELRETAPPPAGWIPVGGSWQHGRLHVRWSWFGAEPLRQSFFAGDVQRSRFKPFNRLFQHVTPIERLPQCLQQHPPLRPNGFIFHMSRCGSTLVAQMLAALADNVMLSEASPIDDVVRARQIRPDLTEDEHAGWLAGIVGALGQPRGGERRLFVKLDCWHTLALPLFRRAFPGVPWVFLYRDPIEVMVSQRRLPGMQMIPGALGPELLGIAPTPDRPDDYCARVLARICEPIEQQIALGGGLLVNYRDLPAALWTTILPHFGVATSEQDRAAMAAAARYDAKEPSFEFTPDAETKQRAASAATRAAASERLGDIYGRLEALRLGT